MESIEDVLNLDENNKLKLNKVLIKINNLNSIKFNKWLNKITKTLKKYVKELNLNNIEIYETGRLGIVFSAHSSLGNLVAKVIPDYLNIYDIEYNAYKKLSKSYMCPLVKYDNKNQILFLKKLECTNALDYKINKIGVKKFFDIVYLDRNKASLGDKKYIDVLKENINILDKKNLLLKYKRYEDKVFNIYNDYFSSKDLYLMHLDLHKGNILKCENNYYAIDPLGYAAPIEFMFVRFIIVELFYSDEIENYFKELLSFISNYFDTKVLLKALYIDAYLFLVCLIVQIKNSEIFIGKVEKIIKLIRSYRKDI